MRKTPWWRNLGLMAQTIHEHRVDDPVQLILQIFRRAPDSVARPMGSALVLAGRAGRGVLSAVGHEIRGERERAEAALSFRSDRRLSGQAVAHGADAVLGWGDADRARTLLNSVALPERGAAWHAVAARLALHEGDLDGAVQWSAVYPRNRALCRRLEGERRVFADYRPRVAAPEGYQPRPGRVLHVLTNSLPHTSSGYAHRSHSILQAVSDRGFQVRAVTRPGYPVQVGIPWGAWSDTIEGIRYSRLVPRRMAQGLDERLDQHAALLAAEVEEFRPALLHTTTHFTNALVVRAVATAYSIPWVYEVRGQLADTWASARGAEAQKSQRYRQFVAREAEVARSADAVVTLGEGMRQILLDSGVAADKIMVCPNAVGDVFTATPPTSTQARTELGLDPAGQYVGTVSSIVDYEGLDYLVRAVARLAPEFPRLRLLIAGDGVSRARLEVLSASLGIADRCLFPGRIPRDRARLYHAALDIFAAPRRDLPVTRSVTPMKTVEASATGRPVVASDLPALAELVDDGRTGLLVRPDDEAALADALAELVQDPQRAERLGAAGRRWVLETRTWAANAERYAELYASLGVAPADDGG